MRLIAFILSVCSILSADTVYVATARGQILNAIPKLRAGDTLLIKPGNYGPFSDNFTGAAGTADKRIVVRGETPNTVNITCLSTITIWFTVTHPYWTFENLNLDGDSLVNHAFKLNASQDAGGYHSSYMHVRNCKFKNFSETPIKAGAYYKDTQGNLIWFNEYWPADYLIWENNDNTGNTYGENGNGNGLNLDGAKNVIFRNNYYHLMRRNPALWGSGQNYATFSAFVKGGSYDCIYEGNVLEDAGNGICFGGGCMDPRGFRFDQTTYETRRCIARNNVVKNCAAATYYCGSHDSLMIYNNTFINSGAVGGDLVVNNLVLGTGAAAAGSAVTATNYVSTTVNNAWFWDAARNNYALKSAATLLIGQGTALNTGTPLTSVLTDMLGAPRPTPPSIGAFELYDAAPAMDGIGIPPTAVEGYHHPYDNNLVLASSVDLRLSPNPAQHTVRVAYRLAASHDDIEVSVCDARGRTIRNLFHGPRDRGEHALSWDGMTHEGAHAGAGMYMVKFRSGLMQFVRPLAFLK